MCLQWGVVLAIPLPMLDTLEVEEHLAKKNLSHDCIDQSTIIESWTPRWRALPIKHTSLLSYQIKAYSSPKQVVYQELEQIEFPSSSMGT